MIRWPSWIQSGKFSIKAFHSFLAPRGSQSFLANVVWNPWTPMTVKFFCMVSKDVDFRSTQNEMFVFGTDAICVRKKRIY